MYVGQMVHYQFGGKCNAAMITGFWEDQSLAALTVFPASGGVPTHQRRAEQGKRWDDDLHWHTLEVCPDVAMETKAVAESAEPSAPDLDPRTDDELFFTPAPLPEPAPKAKRKRGPNKPKS